LSNPSSGIFGRPSEIEKRLDVHPASFILDGWRELLSDLEHFGAANGADALGGGAAILHGDALGALHFPLGAALYTITLHETPPLVILLARIDHS